MSAQTTIILRARRGRKRTYQVDFRDGGWRRPVVTRGVTARCRIRQLCIVVFRKWFGREPSQHWHKDGLMAEAWDKRGNRVTVSQFNNEFPRFPLERGLLLAENVP